MQTLSNPGCLIAFIIVTFCVLEPEAGIPLLVMTLAFLRHSGQSFCHMFWSLMLFHG